MLRGGQPYRYVNMSYVSRPRQSSKHHQYRKPATLLLNVAGLCGPPSLPPSLPGPLFLDLETLMWTPPCPPLPPPFSLWPPPFGCGRPLCGPLWWPLSAPAVAGLVRPLLQPHLGCHQRHPAVSQQVRVHRHGHSMMVHAWWVRLVTRSVGL